MAVAVKVVLSGLSRHQYDAIRTEVGWLDEAPVGGLAHITWWEGDDCHSLDSWESEAAFAAFGEQRLGPALAKLGIEIEVSPQFYPAHEVFLPKAATVTTS